VTLYSEYFQQQNALRGHFHQCVMDIYVLNGMVAEFLHFENAFCINSSFSICGHQGCAEALCVTVDDRH